MPGDLQTTTVEEGTDYISHSMDKDTPEGEWDTMRCDTPYSGVVVGCVKIGLKWREGDSMKHETEGYSAKGSVCLHLYYEWKTLFEPVIRCAFLWKLPIVFVTQDTGSPASGKKSQTQT